MLTPRVSCPSVSSVSMPARARSPSVQLFHGVEKYGHQRLGWALTPRAFWARPTPRPMSTRRRRAPPIAGSSTSPPLSRLYFYLGGRSRAAVPADAAPATPSDASTPAPERAADVGLPPRGLQFCRVDAPVFLHPKCSRRSTTSTVGRPSCARSSRPCWGELPPA